MYSVSVVCVREGECRYAGASPVCVVCVRERADVLVLHLNVLCVREREGRYAGVSPVCECV